MIEPVDTKLRYSLFGLNKGKQPILIRKYESSKPAIADVEKESRVGTFENFYVMLYGSILIYAVQVADHQKLH